MSKINVDFLSCDIVWIDKYTMQIDFAFLTQIQIPQNA